MFGVNYFEIKVRNGCDRNIKWAWSDYEMGVVVLSCLLVSQS